jgi:hypothetical protein
MLILVTIFLCLFIPLVMLILHLVRPRLNIQGFLAVAAVLASWVLVFLARSDIPRTIQFPAWRPDTLFTLSPTLLIDQNSWYLALALASLSLTVVITSISRLGQSQARLSPAGQIPSSSGQLTSDDVASSDQPDEFNTLTPGPSWVLWAQFLALNSLGILAVCAGNLLTLLLAWTALDLIELPILLGRMLQSRTRERIIMAFSAKMAGICLVIGAGIILWSSESTLTFESITPPASTLLLLAAGLRLGVIPIHLPFNRGLPINRNLGTMIRLVPASASYMLLVRLSSVGLMKSFSPYLLVLTVLTGIYAAILWLRARDEIIGRPFWLLTTSSLVLAAAIVSQPAACLAWAITSLLSGGFIFSMSLRHKNLLPLAVLGMLNLSALPFTPTWQGTKIFEPTSVAGLNPTILAIFSFLLLVIQAFLMSGFIRHMLRGVYVFDEAPLPHTERWVWFLYPLGLALMLITHILIGIFMLPRLSGISLVEWAVGPVVVIFVGAIHFLGRQYRPLFQPRVDPNVRSTWDRIFAFEWLYRLLWGLYRSLSRVFSTISSILEGEGGLLWALVLLGLIFVFLQR